VRRNLSHIIAAAFNEPLLLEPAYARVFFCALGREIGAASLSVPQQQVQLDAPGMLAETDEYMAGGKRPARVYRVVNGIAVLPVTGTLVHRLGGMRPFSGMTGYDGIVACLQQAMADSQVRGVLLDIDSPGGQAAGAFDCADMIYRLRQQKPVWALCNDTACSAAMLLASACSRRLVTQTSRIGSIGVMMSHVSYAGHLAQAGVDITLIYAGAHKVDGNQFEALPAEVRQDMQQRIDAAHRMFAEKVAMYTGLSVDAVTGTEAAVFEGQSGIEAGLADELINASDAISVMATALNSNVRGGTMPQLTATEAAVQENQRVMGILTCQEAKGREQLATMLAGQQGMSVEQARAILAAAAPQQPVASAQSEADRIMACEEANGREQLAAAPLADAGPSLRDQIMALDEAKGAEAQAEKLAACPGMTVENARAVLAAGSGKAEPVSASTTALFEHFMANHSPAAVRGGVSQTSADGDADVKMLMAMP
jgi:signal peptide peptidase SppA